MSLTVHFVGADFTMKSRCLQTAFFSEDHTGEALAHGLKEALAYYYVVLPLIIIMLDCVGYSLNVFISLLEHAMKD